MPIDCDCFCEGCPELIFLCCWWMRLYCNLKSITPADRLIGAMSTMWGLCPVLMESLRINTLWWDEITARSSLLFTKDDWKKLPLFWLPGLAKLPTNMRFCLPWMDPNCLPWWLWMIECNLFRKLVLWPPGYWGPIMFSGYGGRTSVLILELILLSPWVIDLELSLTSNPDL